MSRRVFVVDNYDSFTYNLVQAIQILGAQVVVKRNDETSPDDLNSIAPSHVLVSPGPGRPENAGSSVAIIEAAMSRFPVLGVCLGHQAVAQVLGSEIRSATTIMHGKTSAVYHDNRTLYEGLPNPFEAGRYHSLAVSEPTDDAPITVSAYTSDGEVMGVRHKTLPTEGVQFHPESILTPGGDRLLRNFLDLDPVTRT